MRNVPYHDNPGNACALACYIMIAQYLLPGEDISFEQLGRIANWKKGYVVWGFPVWKWLMDKGMYMTDYDVINYEAWAKKGLAGLKRSVPEKEFNYYQKIPSTLRPKAKTLAQCTIIRTSLILNKFRPGRMLKRSSKNLVSAT